MGGGFCETLCLAGNPPLIIKQECRGMREGRETYLFFRQFPHFPEFPEFPVISTQSYGGVFNPPTMVQIYPLIR